MGTPVRVSSVDPGLVETEFVCAAAIQSVPNKFTQD